MSPRVALFKCVVCVHCTIQYSMYCILSMSTLTYSGVLYFGASRTGGNEHVVLGDQGVQVQRWREPGVRALLAGRLGGLDCGGLRARHAHQPGRQRCDGVCSRAVCAGGQRCWSMARERKAGARWAHRHGRASLTANPIILLDCTCTLREQETTFLLLYPYCTSAHVSAAHNNSWVVRLIVSKA